MKTTPRDGLLKSTALLVAAVLLVGCGSLRTADTDTAAKPAPAPAAATAPAAKPPPATAPADAPPRIERRPAPERADEPVAESGIASWYGKPFHGRRTASGEIYDMHAMTAAHKTMPLPSYARVRNPANGREVVVRVNDRGPFKPGRIIDLSRAAARALGIDGLAPVLVTRLPSDALRNAEQSVADARR